MSAGDGKQQEARALIADHMLVRIAKRYKNCSVNIYPDFPELSPVEAVLRCAQEEGFTLSQVQPSHASGEGTEEAKQLAEAYASGEPRYEDRIHQAIEIGHQRGARAMAEKAAQAIKSIAYSNGESAYIVWQRCFDAAIIPSGQV